VDPQNILGLVLGAPLVANVEFTSKKLPRRWQKIVVLT